MYYYIRISVCCLFWLVSANVNAQSATDSYNQFKKYRTAIYDSALLYATKTVDFAVLEKDSTLLMKGYNALGWLKEDAGELSESIHLYEKALKVAERIENYDFQIYITNNLGSAHINRGDYDRALEYYLLSLDLRKQFSDEASMSVSLNNIGLVYYKLKQYDKAIQYFIESTEIDKKYGLQSYLISTNNIAHCYVGQKKYQLAIEKYDEVISSSNEISDDILVSTYNGLGVAYINIKAYSLAEENFLVSEKLNKHSLKKDIGVINKHYLSSIALERGDLAKASEYNKIALREAVEMELKQWQRNTTLIASLIEEKIGNSENALEFYKSYTALNDSLLNEQVVQNIHDLENDFNNKMYEQHLASMDLQIAKKNKLNTLLMIMVGMVSIVGLVLYNANKNRKRATKLISKAYIEVERQKNILEEAVKERTRELDKSNQDLTNFIYRTSHDIRGPLATLKGICNIALMDVDDPVAIKYFNKLELTSDRLIDILSRIQHINLIKNYKLENTTININSLLNDIMDGMDENVKSNARYIIDIPECEMVNSDPNLLKLALKNIIHNSFKFSRRNELEESIIVVEAQLSGDHYHISVTDNGYGIEQGEMNKIFDLFYKNDLKVQGQNSAGIGLHLAEMAIKKLNGSIEVKSIPMVRTTFTISVPVEKFAGIRQ